MKLETLGHLATALTLTGFAFGIVSFILMAVSEDSWWAGSLFLAMLFLFEGNHYAIRWRRAGGRYEGE